MQSEPEHSVVLSVAHALQREGHPFRPPYYMATVEKRGEVVGCALRPPPDGITLTRMPLSAMAEIAAGLARTGRELPDASGPEPQAAAFAQHWAELQDLDWGVECRYRWYSATRVEDPPARAPGTLRIAGQEDVSWLRPWATAYASEVWASAVDVPAFFDRRVATRSMYVWDHGGPCAVAAVSGATPNSSRISAVYTPPQHRGRGYASTLVADVTREVLSGGRRWCVLSAEVANRKINAMYRRLGYSPVCDTAAITFSART
ncbi:MAG: GNAT family N-acetyltransferase [Gammaproteobacteria bacterium]|nr:GNAT family N-acetyltransferase [Gammaproteobacteria bacterium]